MIKKVLKGLGVVAAGGLVIGVFWYFQSLKIDGDPLLKTCWGVDIFDDVTGEKVVGAEDLDFDPETGTVFLSAYDRRAVDREIKAGKVTTQGGIYTFQVSDITESNTLNVTDISREFKEEENIKKYGFRPHGFALGEIDGAPLLAVVNRRFDTNDDLKTIPEWDGSGSWITSIDVFTISPKSLVLEMTKEQGGACDPNNVTFWNNKIYSTDSNLPCNWGNRIRIRTIFYQVRLPDKFESSNFSGDFLNGITVWTGKNLTWADTWNSKIFIFDPEKRDPTRLYDYPKKEFAFTAKIDLPIAPDNLTVDENDNLYVAGFPNLLDYFYYMKGWFGVKKSPSVAYRISPDDYAQELLFKDDGSMISGATVALRAGDYLILGSGWDDNIAICSGMGALD